jgi:antitoxin component YwqK of YwqJK toxin-antitoxin module
MTFKQIDINSLTQSWIAGEMLAMYGGEPFTGEAVGHSTDGVLISQSRYRNGILHGFEKRWYLAGSPRSQADYQFGVIHGFERKWDEGGQLVYETECQYGMVLHRRRWDSQGALIDEYFRQRNAWLDNWLKQMAERYPRIE